MDFDSQAKPHLPPRPDAAELELATEQFIELHGSKRAAMRAIERAKTKGKPGRPDGPPYLQADAQNFWLVTYLRRVAPARERRSEPSCADQQVGRSLLAASAP